MEITNISTAKTILSKLIAKVMDGEEVIIGKAGKPVAKIVPYEPEKEPRQLGAGNWVDKVWMADDFDETPQEIIELFYESEIFPQDEMDELTP